MMERHIAVVVFLALFLAKDAYSQPPASWGNGGSCRSEGNVPSCTKDVFLSVVTNGEGDCGRLVEGVPLYATLYEAMLFAEQQGMLSFDLDLHPKYGHFIKEVNDVANAAPSFWCVYDSNGVPLPVGVDFTYPSNQEHYIWNFEDTTGTHCSSYNGVCLEKGKTRKNGRKGGSGK